jgi:hypothetical protein
MSHPSKNPIYCEICARHGKGTIEKARRYYRRVATGGYHARCLIHRFVNAAMDYRGVTREEYVVGYVMES